MIHQYYYHDNGCKADSAESKDCICWHDEGTGPFVNERHDHKNRRIYNLNLHWRVKPDELHWRVKPDELADLKLRCEEQQQKLDEMAKAFSQQQDRIKRLEEAGKELRECASQLGWTSSEDPRWIGRAEAAVEAWDKEAKP